MTKSLLVLGLFLVTGFQQKPDSRKMHVSWYCESGKRMANGKPMNCEFFTAASNSLPLGTLIFIENPENGRGVYAVITDKGPFVKDRELDVSLAVAKKLDFVKKGVVELQVRVVSTPGETK